LLLLFGTIQSQIGPLCVVTNAGEPKVSALRRVVVKQSARSTRRVAEKWASKAKESGRVSEARWRASATKC